MTNSQVGSVYYRPLFNILINYLPFQSHLMKLIRETLRVQRNVISTFALILFGNKHQLTSLLDRQDDNMLENGKCRN